MSKENLLHKKQTGQGEHEVPEDIRSFVRECLLEFSITGALQGVMKGGEGLMDKIGDFVDLSKKNMKKRAPDLSKDTRGISSLKGPAAPKSQLNKIGNDTGVENFGRTVDKTIKGDVNKLPVKDLKALATYAKNSIANSNPEGSGPNPVIAQGKKKLAKTYQTPNDAEENTTPGVPKKDDYATKTSTAQVSKSSSPGK